MTKGRESALLFFTTLLLWMVHTAFPAYCHFIEFLPQRQVVNQLVGIAIILLDYKWLHTLQDGKVSLTNSLFFLFCAYLVTTGLGIHVACVVLQEVMTQSNELFHLIDFLHEIISHNMFVGGFYAIMAVIMVAESKKALGHQKTNKEKGDQKFLWGNNSLLNIFFQYVWPIVIGLYFSIFASITGTTIVTLIFYAYVIFYFTSTMIQLRSSGITPFSIHSICNSQLLVLGGFTKAAVVGIPVLFAFPLSI